MNNTPSSESSQPSTPAQSVDRAETPRRRKLWVTTAFVAVLASATALTGCGWRSGGWSHGGEPGERLGHVVDKVFSRVDANDEQKSKLTAIVQAAYKDLAPMRSEIRGARNQAIDLLAAEKVDRAALEALRAKQTALVDTASKRVSTALADMAEVLTPEQRKAMGEKAKERLSKRGGWHRG